MSAALAAQEPIAMSCAWVRCKLLKMPVADYATLLGVSENTVRSLERPSSSGGLKRELHTFTTVARAWDSLADRVRKKNPSLAVSLHEARQNLLDSLPRVDTSSSFGILNRWRYEVGAPAFEAASGLSYANLWARQKDGIFLEFHKLLTIGQTLRLIPDSSSPQKVLESPMFQALERAWLSDCDTLGRPRSIARLHILLAIADITLVADTLHHHQDIKLSSRQSDAIAKFAPVSWAEVSPVVSFLRSKGILAPEGDLEKDLQQQLSIDAEQIAQSFEGRLRQLAEQHALDNGKLADLFGLRSPEREKAALPIYRALQYGEYDRTVPPGVLALLLASSNEEAGDLLDQKRAEIAESLVRQGRGVSDLNVERQLWKLSYFDIPHDKDTIQAIEWGKPCKTPEEAVVNDVLQIGLQRAFEVLLRWHRTRDFSSIKSVVSSLLYQTPHNTLEAELETSARRLKSIAVGGEVPPLATVKRLLSKPLGAMPPRLERDWFDSYAKFQVGVNQTDMERLISTYIASRSETIGAFFEERGLPHQTCARLLAAVSNCGTISAEDFETLTRSLGIEPSSPFHTLLSLVNSTGTVAAALPIFASELIQANDSDTIREIKALKSAYSIDHKERERFRKGNVSLGELLDIRQGRGAQQAPIRGESQAMRCLHTLPGLTAQEIASIKLAQTIGNIRTTSTLHRLLDRAKDRGLSLSEITFALQKLVVVSRQSQQQTALALSIPLASSLTPTGVIAYLVSADVNELDTWIAECRTEAKAALVSAGLKPSPLQIEMRIWGVRDDDIKMERHALGAVLWNPSAQSEDAERLLAQILEIGASKAANALERLIVSRRAVLTPDLCRVFVECHASGSNGLSIDAHLPLGAAVRYAEGKLVPTQRQLEAMAEAIGVPLTPRHRLGHHFSLAEQVATVHKLPLERCMSHLAFMAPQRESSSAGSATALRNAQINLLTAAGLDTKKNRALLFKSDPAEAGYWKLCQQILHALGHGENSPLYDYALCLYLYQDTRTALSHWGKGRAGIEGAFPDLGALKAFCSEMSRGTSVPGDEVSTTELLREKETAREVGMNGADMEGLLEFALNFPGARIADFIEDSAESHYTRTFSAMHAESDEAANDGTGVVAINGARRLAVVAREEEEREVVADADWIQKAAEARKKEDALIGRFTESVGGPRTTCPTLEVLQKWAKNLASLVSASEIATLPERYPSLLISVREAPSKNLSFEAAFVRKAVELVNRDRERKKDAEKGDSGRRVFSLNL